MYDVDGFRINNAVPNRVTNTLQGVRQVSGRAFQKISELVSPLTRLGNCVYDDIRKYSDAYLSVFNQCETTLAALNAITPNSGLKHDLAKVTASVAAVGTTLHAWQAWSSQEANTNTIVREISSTIIGTAITGVFVFASAKTGDDEAEQERAEILSWIGLSLSVVKIALDFVGDRASIFEMSVERQANETVRRQFNQLQEQRAQPEQNRAELEQNLQRIHTLEVQTLNDAQTITQLRAQEKTDQNQIRELQEEVQTLNDAQTIAQLRAQVNTDQNQIHELQEKVRANNEVISPLQTRVSNLTEQLSHADGIRQRRPFTVAIGQRRLLPKDNNPTYFRVSNLEFLNAEDRANKSLNSGISYLGEIDHTKAFQFFDNALVDYSEIKLKKGLAATYKCLGQAYEHLSYKENPHENLNKALSYYKDALNLNKELGRKESQLTNYRNIGNLLMHPDVNQENEAIKCYDEALKIHKRLGLSSPKTSELLGWGHGYRERGDLSSAIKFYNEALIEVEQLGGQESLMDAYNCEAIQHHVVNDFKRAIQSYIKALEISEKLYLKEEIASIHGHLGLAYEDDGQLELAIDSYKAALDFDLQVGVKTIGVANNYSNLGNAYRLLGNATQVMQYYDKSILCHEEALHINQKLGANEGAASNHGNLGQLLEIKCKYEQALTQYENAVKLFGEEKCPKKAEIVQNLFDKLILSLSAPVKED